MQWMLAGLGNPGQEYTGSRHNVGRDFLHALANDLPGKPKILDLDVYMNHSGGPIKKAVPSPKAAERLVVVHDDLDLPLGSVKLSFGSGSGGHRGVESIIKALKTRDFVRVRVGICPTTPGGKLKKPDAKKVVDFVLGQFKPAERDKLKKVKKTVKEALALLLADGLAPAMTATNTR
ncbi:aminoacyl-tRNA hydrolase [Patescibacteria group bacterium]|nr:aminoacyl-tRNA hydrolase [Patescibacteria group bacterium]